MSNRGIFTALITVAFLIAPQASQARWMNARTGRFFTMDSFAGAQQEAQSLHKYLYCADSPVDRSDPLGRWGSKSYDAIHQMAIRKELAGYLSADDIKILCDMQIEVDKLQDASDSFMHGMSDGSHGQKPEAAKQKANDRVRTLLSDARKDEAKGTHEGHEAAMKELGGALHTLQDSTSPAHHNFQAWYDYKGGQCNPHEWVHAGKELIYPGTGSWLETATLRGYNYFKGHDTLPTDFFSDLGGDGVGDEFFHFFHPPTDIMPRSDVGTGLPE